MINDDGKKHKSIIKIIIFTGLVFLIIIRFNDVIGMLVNLYLAAAPMILGAVIAFVLNILVTAYERIYFSKTRKKVIIKSRRGVCIFLSIVTIILVLIFFLNIIIPQIVQFVNLLIKRFPVVYEKSMEWALEHSDDIPALQQKVKDLNMNGEEALKKALQLLGNWTLGTVTFVGSAFGAVINLILALTFGIYILAGKEDLKSKADKLLKAYMKEGRRKRLYEILNTANETFSNYIIGQCKEAVILGILCTTGMIVLRFPYAKIIGPVIGMTALIPMLGAYIGAALGFLLIMSVDFTQALLFILFIVALQQIEGNLIYPKVVGESIGLPGIWVFAAVIVGGGLMGIPGILFGVPLIATIYKLLDKSVNERLSRMKKDKK